MNDKPETPWDKGFNVTYDEAFALPIEERIDKITDVDHQGDAARASISALLVRAAQLAAFYDLDGDDLREMLVAAVETEFKIMQEIDEGLQAQQSARMSDELRRKLGFLPQR